MSEQIKRYALNLAGEMCEWPLGNYTLASDHDRIVAKLAERCSALEDRNERIRDHSKFVAEATNRIGAALRAVKEALGLPIDASVLEDLTPAINALRAELEQMKEKAATAPAQRTDPSNEHASFQLGYREGATVFASYLLDNCERETVYEENLQQWLGDMLRAHPAKPTTNGQAVNKVWVRFDRLENEALEWAICLTEARRGRKPKTHGCHHNGPVCPLCKQTLLWWIRDTLGTFILVPASLMKTSLVPDALVEDLISFLGSGTEDSCSVDAWSRKAQNLIEQLESLKGNPT